MGELWVHDGDEWVTAIPMRSNGVAHDPVFHVFRYNNNQWEKIWQKVPHPPNAPTVSVVQDPGNRDRIRVTATNARSQPSRIIKMVVKLGVNKQPTTATASDGTYYTAKVTQNNKQMDWSDWLADLGTDIPEGRSRWRTFPISGISALPLDTPLHVAAWVQDEFFQWSPAGRATFRTRKPDPPAPKPTPTPAPKPAPKPPAPKRQPDLVLNCSWHRTFEASGYVAQATQGSLYQGRTPYYPSAGIYRSMAGFPSMTSKLRGATIHSIEVYVYAQHWHYYAGGVASIGYHGQTSRPAKFSQTASQQVTQRFTARGQGRWIKLPTSSHAGFRDGRHRGITFYRNSNNVDYYGYFDPSRLRIRVKYSK